MSVVGIRYPGQAFNVPASHVSAETRSPNSSADSNKLTPNFSAHERQKGRRGTNFHSLAISSLFKIALLFAFPGSSLGIASLTSSPDLPSNQRVFDVRGKGKRTPPDEIDDGDVIRRNLLFALMYWSSSWK